MWAGGRRPHAEEKSLLDPGDGISEVLFSLIMALAFPLSAQRNRDGGQRTADADHENTHDPRSNSCEVGKGITADKQHCDCKAIRNAQRQPCVGDDYKWNDDRER